MCRELKGDPRVIAAQRAQQRDVIRARQVLAEVDEASKNGDLYEHQGVMARAIRVRARLDQAAREREERRRSW